MSLIKYIGKLLSKYHDVGDLETISAKPNSNMIATTTIINQKKISRVIHSYSALGHSLVRIQKKSYRRRNVRPVPLAESSTIASQTLCNSCQKKRPVKKYCKCCGKSVKEPKMSKKCVVWLEDKQHLYRHRQIDSIRRNDKFKNVVVRDKQFRGCLKKSKAMTNIKHIEYKSFLSNKRKYSSTLSSTSTWQDNADRKRKQIKEKICQGENLSKLEQKINGTFVVDFASTPIKLAPKTSTPVKIRKF